MESPDYEFLVSIHEQIEQWLCYKAGIPIEVIDQWDMEHEESDDPGSLEGCPYKEQHQFAVDMEIFLADKLGVIWKDYDAAFGKLVYTKEEKK